jgi:hypothetical protein
MFIDSLALAVSYGMLDHLLAGFSVRESFLNTGTSISTASTCRLLTVDRLTAPILRMIFMIL